MKKVHTIILTIALPLMALGIVFATLAADPTQAAPPARPLYATCTVNSTADSGAGSLRACLQSAGPGDTVVFDTAVFPPASPAAISLSNALPSIITNSVTIDGSSTGLI